MATCEELDQTVTDLTDDLHAKVREGGVKVPNVRAKRRLDMPFFWPICKTIVKG